MLRGSIFASTLGTWISARVTVTGSRSVLPRRTFRRTRVPGLPRSALVTSACSAASRFSGSFCAAIAGVLGSVKDRYTVFVSPKWYAALEDGLHGTSFGGVGL